MPKHSRHERFFMLRKALENQVKAEALTEAFNAIVAAYYEEYTDATELDGQTYSALEHLFGICFPFGETVDGREFEKIVQKRM